ncbi:MAG: V-type ATP synthase subunit A [Patescibacteria group bacterium]|nr:V-type ATP synthase subunit A [Patescibacteria group bacterium]
MQEGFIKKISGPLVIGKKMTGVKMYDLAKVSEKKLIGEIIKIEGDEAAIQVYEETAGLGPGEPIYLEGKPLTVELGPGLISSIYDGIQRPLNLMREEFGDYISRGIELPALERNKKWDFQPKVKKGEEVEAGDILGSVQETSLVEHRIMVPPNIKGKIKEIKKGKFTVEEVIALIETKKGIREITMKQEWPIRQARPVKARIMPKEPLVTGQRVIDTFFPVAKGGTACVPGPFGSGKTVVQHQLAKWADAEIIIFIGCGERGNEMADVLLEFPHLLDPRSGEPLMKRTVLIANTSNMPVAAREASIYTGITIAEYFRDMGYKVALMADSTSRWAEALREVSGRLEEMPGEEGYPAYLGSRTAGFYERAGEVICLGKEERIGSLAIIGAVSPPGGDFSEPVTQNTLRVTKVFWALDDNLASQRHFPALNWLTSYSLYTQDLDDFLKKEIASDFPLLRTKAMDILQEEAKLQEIVRLVGVESLSEKDQLTLLTAKSIREDFLQQNAFDEIDTYTSLKKQYLMLKTIITFHEVANKRLIEGKPFLEISSSPLREKIAKIKFISEKELEKIEDLIDEIENL